MNVPPKNKKVILHLQVYAFFNKIVLGYLENLSFLKGDSTPVQVLIPF
jgi:hypothetical protein